MEQPGLDFLWPAPAKRAATLPACLGADNATFWDDICDVLLDSEPDPLHAEVVRRWLREQVEEDLRQRLAHGNGRHLVAWACQAAPRMTWKLPYSRADPPPRHRRRVIAVLLPHKLQQLERELARLAFSWRFRPVAAPRDEADGGPDDGPEGDRHPGDAPG